MQMLPLTFMGLPGAEASPQTLPLPEDGFNLFLNQAQGDATGEPLLTGATSETSQEAEISVTNDLSQEPDLTLASQEMLSQLWASLAPRLAPQTSGQPDFDLTIGRLASASEAPSAPLLSGSGETATSAANFTQKTGFAGGEQVVPNAAEGVDLAESLSGASEQDSATAAAAPIKLPEVQETRAPQTAHSISLNQRTPVITTAAPESQAPAQVERAAPATVTADKLPTAHRILTMASSAMASLSSLGTPKLEVEVTTDPTPQAAPMVNWLRSPQLNASRGTSLVQKFFQKMAQALEPKPAEEVATTGDSKAAGLNLVSGTPDDLAEAAKLAVSAGSTPGKIIVPSFSAETAEPVSEQPLAPERVGSAPRLGQLHILDEASGTAAKLTGAPNPLDRPIFNQVGPIELAATGIIAAPDFQVAEEPTDEPVAISSAEAFDGLRPEQTIQNKEIEKPTLLEAKAKETPESKPVNQAFEAMRDLLDAKRPGKVTIRLNPEELGSLTITVRQTQAGVVAEISASNEGVRQSLHQNRQELSMALEQKGHSLSSLQVTLESPSQQVGSQSRQGQGQAQQPNLVREDFERMSRLASLQTPTTSSFRTISHSIGVNVLA